MVNLDHKLTTRVDCRSDRSDNGLQVHVRMLQRVVDRKAIRFVTYTFMTHTLPSDKNSSNVLLRCESSATPLLPSSSRHQ